MLLNSKKIIIIPTIIKCIHRLDNNFTMGINAIRKFTLFTRKEYSFILFVAFVIEIANRSYEIYPVIRYTIKGTPNRSELLYLIPKTK